MRVADFRIGAGLLAALVLLACGPLGAFGSVLTPTLAPSLTPSPLPKVTVESTVALTTTPLPTTTPSPVPMPTPTPEGPWLTGEAHVFPGPRHYEGDLLTFEVAIESIDELADSTSATVALDEFGTLDVVPNVVYSPLSTGVLSFRWAWDTTDQAGLHRLALTVPLDTGAMPQTLEVMVEVLPTDQRPSREVGAEWAVLETDCCELYYITGTAAERDIDLITVDVEDSVTAVETRIGYLVEKPVRVALIDNIWGNGAYATWDGLVITYTDRDYTYAGLGMRTVVMHEATHWATLSLGTETPSILVEGLAVYVAGGHYKPEPIPERTAALLELGQYVPLEDLANGFWNHQHEIAYLEGAALTSYLVDMYGWESFLEAYTLEGIEAGTDAEWLNLAFLEQYDATLAEVERGMLAWLTERAPGEQVYDLDLTLALFDTMRSYQVTYAPYQVGLPLLSDALATGATSEFLRRPVAWENVTLETMLLAGQVMLRDGRYADAESLVVAVGATLDDGDFTRAPVADYFAIVQLLGEMGYEVQYIDIGDETAQVTAIADWPTLEVFNLVRGDGMWQFVID